MIPLQKKLLYEEIPNKYIWDGKQKKFLKRKTKGFAIGRINHVPSIIDDSYHLRILINSKRGMTSFDHIKTVNGVVHKTYRDTCYTLGLLDDDKEYIEGIKEAHFMCSPKFVRRLFVIMLISDSLSTPKIVWEETWHILAEDILRKKKEEFKRPGNIHKFYLFKNYASTIKNVNSKMFFIYVTINRIKLK